MKQNRVVWMFLASLVVLIGAGAVYAASLSRSGSLGQKPAEQESAIVESVARRGDLTVSVSAAGRLAASAEADLGFQTGGMILEMNVTAGDVVHAGEVLARLQVNKTASELASEIASAELAVLKAQQALDQLNKNAALESARALLALENARRAVENVQNNQPALAAAWQALASAEQAVADAEMQLYIQKSTSSQEAKDIAHASLLFKEKQLRETEIQISRLENAIKNAPSKTVRDGLKQQLIGVNIQLLQQQSDYENRLDQYNRMDEPAGPVEYQLAQAELNTAQLQFIQAQRDLEKVKAGAVTGELALAQAELEMATREWENRKDGADPDELALAEAQLMAARAKLSLLAKEKLVDELLAPISGTVLSVNVEAGDQIGDGVVLTLARLDEGLLEVYLDETDFGGVRVGNRAEVVFEAFPNQSYTGKVVQVDPSLVQMGGDEVVHAGVLLDALPEFKTPGSFVGLNCSVEIISGQVENAVLIPVEALHETAAGEYVVYVVENGTLEQRKVSVGLQDLTSAEIVAGLSAGEAVALGDVSALKGQP